MTTSIADYIFTRLQQLGVKKVFGVPGDYNLKFLDEFDNHKGKLEWVGWYVMSSI